MYISRHKPRVSKPLYTRVTGGLKASRWTKIHTAAAKMPIARAAEDSPDGNDGC